MTCLQQIKRILPVALMAVTLKTWAACPVLTTAGKPANPAHDEIAQLLASSVRCPDDVFKFRHLLKYSGLQLETTMVANRGFHNPAEGSFSLFEMVSGTSSISHNNLLPGDFFFGHFTAVSEDNQLVADQTPTKGALMIEAFAWDNEKNLFNFYELRGNGERGQWFYRGDSADVLADNQFLHRQPDAANPQFGNRLRCSACHDHGGPIMKELHAPHNDWWTPQRKLDFQGRQPDATLRDMMVTLVSPDRLTRSVVLGIKKLSGSTSYQAAMPTLQEQLRPLFCAVEVNFRSDITPNELKQPFIAMPTEFLIDPILLTADTKHPLMIARKDYEAALASTGSHFPETTLMDADHAWLAPVKATSDHQAITALLQQHIIDAKFAADVIAIDMTNPAFSTQRCKLLTLLPAAWTPDWQAQFVKKLEQSEAPSARQLAEYLKDQQMTPPIHQKHASEFLNKCRTKLHQSQPVINMYQLLVQRRLEIKASEISKNPRGQILEPGFRVIFPEVSHPPTPGQFHLDAECNLADADH